jgi:hypothetical protein
MEEKMFSWLPSGTGRAEDYYESLRRREYQEPEKALLLAILEDAVGCYQKYCSAHDKTGTQRFRDAEHWIMEEKGDSFFSFVNVCELLGLDPRYLRQGLQQWKQKALQKEKARSRRDAREEAA